MPTGGPQDKQPPVIVESSPKAESVNVTSDMVRIVFSEFVDQASFAQALSVTPAFDRPLEYRWRKKRVDITFPEPLRENTTYILTLDTGLRDVNRVALTEPITLAFATGPVINRGKLAGKVIDPLEGEGVAGFDVFAYAVADSIPPDSLPEKPAYRTQTDDNGTFKFDYMSEQLYFVIGLADRNRNRMPDGIEAFAVPPEPAIFADSLGTDPTLTWLVTQSDTIPPSIQRVRSISNARYMLRFSESIQLISIDPAAWSLTDSLSGETVEIEHIYLYEEDPRQLYLQTPPLAANTHFLIPGGIADSSDNPVVVDTLDFTPSASSDTLQLRFLGFAPDDLTNNEIGAAVLPPEIQAGIRFNKPLSSDTLKSFVSIQDTSAQNVSFDVSSTNGTVYFLEPNEAFSRGMPFTIQINGSGVGVPDTTFTKQFQQLTDSNLGELSGVAIAEQLIALPFELAPVDSTQLVATDSTAQDTTSITPEEIATDSIAVAIPDSALVAPDSTTGVETPPEQRIPQRQFRTERIEEARIVIELYPSVDPLPAKAITSVQPDNTGVFLFSGLPDKAQYRFRAFIDDNDNGKWDGGQLIPYEGAEPVTWYSDSLQVRARWEQTLSDTLKIQRR